MTHVLDEFEGRTTPQTHHFQKGGAVSREALNHVKAELRQRGAVAYDMWLPETHYLPQIIHSDEHIMGSVYGRFNRGFNNKGRGVLIATDQRVLFLDKKLMFMHCDEITFMIIGSITYTRSPIMAYVTLHTRLGDYQLRTFNLKNAANFVDYIETKCLQNQGSMGEKFEHLT